MKIKIRGTNEKVEPLVELMLEPSGNGIALKAFKDGKEVGQLYPIVFDGYRERVLIRRNVIEALGFAVVMDVGTP